MGNSDTDWEGLDLRIIVLETKVGKLLESQISLNSKVNANYNEVYELILSAQGRISDLKETG